MAPLPAPHPAHQHLPSAGASLPASSPRTCSYSRVRSINYLYCHFQPGGSRAHLIRSIVSSPPHPPLLPLCRAKTLRITLEEAVTHRVRSRGQSVSPGLFWSGLSVERNVGNGGRQWAWGGYCENGMSGTVGCLMLWWGKGEWGPRWCSGRKDRWAVTLNRGETWVSYRSPCGSEHELVFAWNGIVDVNWGWRVGLAVFRIFSGRPTC